MPDLGAVLVLAVDVPPASRGRRRPARCPARVRRPAHAARRPGSVELALDRLGGRGAVEDLCRHEVIQSVAVPVDVGRRRRWSRSVEEVPGAGEVHRHAGGLAAPRRPPRRAPTRRAARSPSPRRRPGSAGRPRTGRTRPTRRPSRRPGRPPASTASRQESTRLTWPIPTPTEAPSAASRIALDFTARQARQANARSASVASAAGSRRPASRSAGSSPPRRVDAVALLHQQAAADRAHLDRRRGRRRPHASSRMFFLRGEHLDRAVVVARRDDDLGEDLRHLLGHRHRHRHGWWRSRRRTPRPGRRRAPCGAPRRRRRRPRCRTGWRA